MSLYLQQAVVRARLGAARGWQFVVVALALGSFGVYIGRFLRLNSWDVVVQPRSFLDALRGHLADPLGDPRWIGVTLVLGAFLGVAYLVLYSFLDGGRERETRS